MKGGLACLLMAVKNLVSDGLEFRRGLLLTFVGDEEAEAKGSRFLIEQARELLRSIKYGVIAEPTQFKITRAQKGITCLRITIRGKAAHGSKPELGDNAIYKACDLIHELRCLGERLKERRDELLGSGTLNVGRISGGTKVNVVPDSCELEIDRRLIPGESPRLAVRQLRQILAKLKIDADIQVLGSARLPMKIPESAGLIRLLKSVTRTPTQAESGYTEAELYWRECGIECVVCGPGDAAMAHMTDEYIQISQLRRGVRVYQELIRKWCC
jgi:acetylornithine deacetylase/succinyl-diaminopimelate desuccinylase-like protein